MMIKIKIKQVFIATRLQNKVSSHNKSRH